VKHLTSLAVAGMLAATVLPASAADLTGAGVHVRVSRTRQMGGHV